MQNEIYKDRYDFEWNHRSHLLEVTNISIAAATIVGSALVAEAQSFSYESSLKLLFLSLWIVSVSALILALYFIARSIIGYGYSHIATPNQLRSYYNELLQWAKDEGKDEPKVIAQTTLEDFIYEKMGEAIDVNLQNNTKKSAYNQKALIAIFISLIFLFLTTIPFLITSTEKHDTIQNVKIISPVNIKNEVSTMTKESNPQNNKPAQQSNTKPQNPPPQGPQNTIIKEHKEKPSK